VASRNGKNQDGARAANGAAQKPINGVDGTFGLGTCSSSWCRLSFADNSDELDVVRQRLIDASPSSAKRIEKAISELRAIVSHAEAFGVKRRILLQPTLFHHSDVSYMAQGPTLNTDIS
jgi:hypothetical protein